MIDIHISCHRSERNAKLFFIMRACMAAVVFWSNLCVNGGHYALQVGQGKFDTYCFIKVRYRCHTKQ